MIILKKTKKKSINIVHRFEQLGCHEKQTHFGKRQAFRITFRCNNIFLLYGVLYEGGSSELKVECAALIGRPAPG